MVDLVRTYPVGKKDGVAPVTGNIGEVLTYTFGDISNRSVNTNYDFTQASIPAGVYLVTYGANCELFENHANALTDGIYNIYARLSAVSLGNADMAQSSATVPPWGNGANSYLAGLSCVGSYVSSVPFTLYLRINCLAYGTFANTWFRTNVMTVKLTRIA